jgi:nucleoside-triphosphatase
MGKVIFLTGAPGSGKTTVIQKVIAHVSRKVIGFITQEIREGGRRKGFKIITLDGREAIMAHVDIRGKPRIGKYGVDLGAIEEMAVKSLGCALDEGCLTIIDEIGPMEILSEGFRQIVIEILNRDIDVLGTIVKRSLPFTDRIKALPDVNLIEITNQNRDSIVEHVLQLLKS